MLEIVYGWHYLEYDFGPGHPFSPLRWEAISSLLKELDLPSNWVEPSPVDDDAVLDIHTLPFVEAVKFASAGHGPPSSWQFGIGTGDVPLFYGMHEATKGICGGTVEGARRIANGGAEKVLQLGGGLHHAMPGRAAGFCVYNDVAMAIRVLAASGLRVAFLDVDVHHSDGVQEIFYRDPDVLTISLHQSGRTLFPGTGFIQERGRDRGIGSAINVPLQPKTKDDSYLESFEAVVPDAVRDFEPDAIVMEVGADAHYRDPLADLTLTTSAYVEVFERVVSLADELTAGRLLATLGGGYAFDPTIRIWTLLAHRLSGVPLPSELPESWRLFWRDRAGVEIGRAILDPDDAVPDTDATKAASRGNRETVENLLELIGQTES